MPRIASKANVLNAKKEKEILKKDDPFVQYVHYRGLTKFEITVAVSLKFHWYLKTLILKFQKARTNKVETGKL